MTWRHETTGSEGDVVLFGINIFDYEWVRTGRTVRVKDPRYGREYVFAVYSAVIDGKGREFAAGEFSNCVWGFYLPND